MPVIPSPRTRLVHRWFVYWASSCRPAIVAGPAGADNCRVEKHDPASALLAVAARGGRLAHTLQGRWRTRLFLFLAAGSLAALVYDRLFAGFGTSFAPLGCLLALGLVWDVLYQRPQRRCWNRDWPAYLRNIGGLLKGNLLWWLCQSVRTVGFPCRCFSRDGAAGEAWFEARFRFGLAGV